MPEFYLAAGLEDTEPARCPTATYRVRNARRPENAAKRLIDSISQRQPAK